MGKSKDLASLGGGSFSKSLTINGSANDTNILTTGFNYTNLSILADATDGELRLSTEDGSGNNYTKYMTFYTEGGSGPTERMRIDASGRVTMPYQPFFDGYMYTTGALAADTILALSQSSNTGITLGNNNTRLTVPVDGYYFIHASQMAQTINGMYAYFSLLVNGTVKYHSHNNFFSESNKDFHITKVVHMAANDYIEFAWLYIGVSNAWAGTHSTVSVHKLG